MAGARVCQLHQLHCHCGSEKVSPKPQYIEGAGKSVSELGHVFVRGGGENIGILAKNLYRANLLVPASRPATTSGQVAFLAIQDIRRNPYCTHTEGLNGTELCLHFRLGKLMTPLDSRHVCENPACNRTSPDTVYGDDWKTPRRGLCSDHIRKQKEQGGAGGQALGTTQSSASSDQSTPKHPQDMPKPGRQNEGSRNVV